MEARKASSGVSALLGDWARKRRRRGATTRAAAWRARMAAERAAQTASEEEGRDIVSVNPVWSPPRCTNISSSPSAPTRTSFSTRCTRGGSARSTGRICSPSTTTRSRYSAAVYLRRRHAVFTEAALRRPSPFAAVCVQGQKLRRPREGGAAVRAAPQRPVCSPLPAPFPLIFSVQCSTSAQALAHGTCSPRRARNH